MSFRSNPDPANITDAMWKLWESAVAAIPGVKLGGIYASKPGYHNTVNANSSGDYSKTLPLDTQYQPKDKARAIDLTMSDAEMRKRTGYLKAAAEHPEDNRLDAIRSFIGTVDSSQVFCMIHDTDSGGAWRYDYGRDSSHLWHIHISVFTKYCAQWTDGLEAVASVLAGETWEAWKGGGSTVKFIQIADPVTVGDVEIAGGALYVTAGAGIVWMHDPGLVSGFAAFWGIPDPFAHPETVAKCGNIHQAQARCGPFLGRMDEVFYFDQETTRVPPHLHALSISGTGTSGPAVATNK